MPYAIGVLDVLFTEIYWLRAEMVKPLLSVKVECHSHPHGSESPVALTRQHPCLHRGQKISPTRMGYCSSTNFEDSNVS